MFVETLLNFAGVSLTLFAVAHLYMFVSRDKIIKPTVRCRYCRKFISVQVWGKNMEALTLESNGCIGQTMRELLYLARWERRPARGNRPQH